MKLSQLANLSLKWRGNRGSTVVDNENFVN